MALAPVLVLLLGGAAFAESYPLLADDPIDFFPMPVVAAAPPQALGETSGGLFIEYVTIGTDHGIELMAQDGARLTAFIEYQVTGVVGVGASLGFRNCDIESSEVTVRFGDLIQVPVLVYAKFTPTQPLFGSGRTDDEIIVEPFVTFAMGFHLNDYDSHGIRDMRAFGGPPNVELRDFSWSFTVEGRGGIQARIPPGITLGISGGYFWAAPDVRVLPLDDTEHFNMSTYVWAIHGQLHVF